MKWVKRINKYHFNSGLFMTLSIHFQIRSAIFFLVIIPCWHLSWPMRHTSCLYVHFSSIASSNSHTSIYILMLEMVYPNEFHSNFFDLHNSMLIMFKHICFDSKKCQLKMYRASLTNRNSLLAFVNRIYWIEFIEINNRIYWHLPIDSDMLLINKSWHFLLCK